MWSYAFEIPILLILSIIIGFYFVKPRLPVRKNLVFVHLIVAEAAALVTDLIASIMDNNYASFGIGTLKIVNMLYFLAFVERAYMLYLFCATVLRDTYQRDVLIKNIIRIPMYTGIGLSIFSAIVGSKEFPHLIFYIDETGYHSGSMYDILYVCGFYYVFVSMVSWFLFGKMLGRRRERFALLLYNIICCCSLVVRFVWPTILLMDTCILMAIMVVFLTFGNPEYALELRSNSFNRVALDEHMEEHFSRLRPEAFGVTIHNFLEMRDIYGTSQMEEGLILIAKYLRHVFPGCILFYCRNGRFVLISHKDVDFAGKRGEIAERFNRPWKSDDLELYLSVGFVIFETAKEFYSTEIISSTMMKALDKAGALGPGETYTCTESNLQKTEKEKWVRQCIEKVIDDTGFELFLQPIVDSSTGKVVGAEALSRIRDAEGNIIPPGIFIPIAENSGRINELGELVLEETCKFIKNTGLETMGIKWINVNLSPAQFIRTNLAERYSSIVEKYGIDPGVVHLEITEGAMADDSFLQNQLDVMGQKGFLFVVDDYGTGYSNLSRLKKCPFENIKIDMSIIWDYCKKPDDILPNMISTFKKMGFSVTAEGIEDESMADMMKEIGFDYLQGYCYSKPIPASEFKEMYSL